MKTFYRYLEKTYKNVASVLGALETMAQKSTEKKLRAETLPIRSYTKLFLSNY